MNEILKKRIEQSPYRKIHPYKTDVNDAYNQGFEDGSEFALKNQWISIDEALPDCKINVIGRCRDGRIYVMRRCDYGTFYFWDVPTDIPSNNLNLDAKDVTHWMPIPKWRNRDEAKEN